jgi:two-component system, chemotaxis family, protein-glutamate methylesterase/glutaminase
MGQDGVAGLRVVKERGGYVIAQDAETCVVYGMPRAAAVAGIVDRVAGLDEIPGLLQALARSPS